MMDWGMGDRLNEWDQIGCWVENSLYMMTGAGTHMGLQCMQGEGFSHRAIILGPPQCSLQQNESHVMYLGFGVFCLLWCRTIAPLF